MYMMFTFFVAGFMYYSLCIITSEKKISGCGIKKWIPDEIGYYIMLILITCGGFLTQYYFAIFAFLGFSLYAVMCIAEKKYKEILWYFLSMLGAVIIATLLWNYWIYAVSGNGHSGAMRDNLKSFFNFERLYDGYRIAMLSIFQWGYKVGMKIVPVLVVVFMILSIVFEKTNRQIRKFVLFIASEAFLYSVIVRGLTPDYLKSTRYFYAADMLFVVLIIVTSVYIAGVGIKKNVLLKKMVMSAVGVLLGISSFLLTQKGFGIDYYGNANEKKAEMEILNQYLDCPLILVGNDSWKMETYLEEYGMFSSVLRITAETECVSDERLDLAERVVIYAFSDENPEDNEDCWYDSAEIGWFYTIGATQKWYDIQKLTQKEYAAVYVVSRANTD